MRVFFTAILAVLCSCTQVNSDEKLEGIRVVSLSPGITASIVDMGFSDYIIGRSAFCEDQGNAIPVVGDLYNIDYERLLRLQPTHVFVQKLVAPVDGHLERLAGEGSFVLRSWKLDSIVDIHVLGSELATILGGTAPDLVIEQTAISFINLPTLLMTDGSNQQTGLCFGRSTYLDDVWSAMGGVNALHTSGWCKLSLEDIARLSPARIIIVSDIPITHDNPVESLGIPVTKFVHKDVLIPSTRIVEVAQALRTSMVESQ